MRRHPGGAVLRGVRVRLRVRHRPTATGGLPATTGGTAGRAAAGPRMAAGPAPPLSRRRRRAATGTPRRTWARPPGAARRARNGPAWTAVVTADRAYYDRVLAAGGPDAATLDFPAYCPERRFQLTGTELRIGRRSTSRGLEPEIDLSGPPADPGVSHLHAVLIAQPDGSWAVLDPGSANGTQVNGGDIPGGVKVPLHSGDQVHVGAWTLLTIVTG